MSFESEQDADPESVARTIALRLLDTRPRTRHELQVALARRQVPDAAALTVLDRFTEVGLIDDEAFATAWVDSRHTGRNLGRRALAAELNRKGIDPAVASTALQRVSAEDEANVAQALVQRRLRALTRVDEATKTRRLLGLLARRGISGAVASQVVRDALAGDGRA